MKNSNFKKGISMMLVLSFLCMAQMSFAGEKKPSNPSNPVININTATEAELTYLPGIGEKRAKAIVDYRATRPFQKLWHLMKIKGIGKKGFNKMRPYLSLKGATTAVSKITIPKKD